MQFFVPEFKYAFEPWQQKYITQAKIETVRGAIRKVVYERLGRRRDDNDAKQLCVNDKKLVYMSTCKSALDRITPTP